MQDLSVVVGIVAFLLVAGWAALAWLRHGRDPSYLDDSSVLLPAPPPAMTAATATVVAGGGGHVAFMAALLDLASRDEIAFVSEGRDGRADRVGIAFHGGESTDPRVLLNRRHPIGEGESWLLGELKAWHAVASNGPVKDGEAPPPELVAAGAQMFASMLRAGMSTAEDDDSFAARDARQHGLGSLAVPDAAAMERAIEAKKGQPMPEEARKRLETMMAGLSAMSNPQLVAQDPGKYADLMASMGSHQLTPEERQELESKMRDWATQASATQASATPAGPEYLPAAEARRIQAPFLFGTLLQTYAKRHGWVGGLPLLASLRWYALGAAEVVAGLVVMGAGSSSNIELLRAIGGGIAAGGVVTILVGRVMPALSHEGAMMKAQLAAYRRTLAATFAQATTLEEVVASHKLPWLETPDQTLVWGVALGLRKDIEALLARTARGPGQGSGQARTSWVPAWFTARVVAAVGAAGGAGPVNPGPAPNPATVAPASTDPAAMFAGIEAIGSEAYASRSGTR